MSKHYAVIKESEVVDVRTSKSGRAYSHAVLYSTASRASEFCTYHQTLELARRQSRSSEYHWMPVREVLPVVETSKRLTVGDSYLTPDQAHAVASERALGGPTLTVSPAAQTELEHIARSLDEGRRIAAAILNSTYRSDK